MAKDQRRSKTQSRSRKSRKETTSEDILRPRKIVPGIEGRSAWFAKRAGEHEQALSIERLKQATEVAETMLQPPAVREGMFQEAQTIFGLLPHGARQRVKRSPLMVDPQGRVRDVKTYRRTDSAYTTMSPPIEVDSAGFLFIPLNARSAEHLDTEDLIVADVSDPTRLRLNNTFTYWPEEDLLVGRVRRAGRYQVHAWPRNPLLRAAFETVARYWPFINNAPDEKTANTIVDRLIGMLVLDGMDEPEARGLLTRGFRPAFVKHWWDDVEVPKAWLPIGPLPGDNFRGIGRVTQIAIHPLDGNILIAGAAGGGVWRTDNGGVFWWPQMQLEPTLTIGAVAIAPSNPQIMYAASGEDGGGYNPAWSGVGLYRSDNGGYSWKLMTSVASTRFSAIAVHPTKPDTVYLAGNRGLHKSTDGGITWRKNPGQDSLFDGQITDVVVAYEEPVFNDGLFSLAALFGGVPLLSEHVYIGVSNKGVFRSTSAGEQSVGTPAFTKLDGPNQLPSGFDAGWIKLALGRRGAHRQNFLAAKLGSLGSRIFTTIDGGTTWTERAQNVATVDYDEWCSVIAVDPLDENTLYAGAAGELKRTVNGGQNPGDWVSINAGVHPDQQDIVFDPRNPRRLFLANDGGVYRSENRGDNWTFASGYLQITQLYDIDISEKSPQVVAGGAQDNGVYYRDEFGFWRHIEWGDGTQVAIDPSRGHVFYFSAQNGLPMWLRRSLNGGGSHEALGTAGLSGGSPWVTIIKLEPTDNVADPLTQRTMFVCGFQELFRSTNSGQTWQRVEDASGRPFSTAGEITALEFSVRDPKILYLGTTIGALYRGTNGGKTAADWTRIDTPGSPADALFPLSQIQAISINAGNPNDVWLVFGGSGVSFTGRPDMILNPSGISHLFRNRDALNINGWEDVSGSVATMSLPDVPTSAVALDDMDTEVAYAGTDVGVFRTADGGDTWFPFQTDLPRSPVTELRFNRRFRRLFAGTMGRGIYYRDI